MSIDRIKASNPKDAVGTGKVPFSTVPAPVMAEIGLAMLEGARKYGRHNYRAIGVRASVYYDAAMRHMTAWWEGQDIDPDSGLSHVTKALATLTVLRDAMLNEMCADDRPPASLDQGWVSALNEKAKEIIAKYPDAKEPYVNTPKAAQEVYGRSPAMDAMPAFKADAKPPRGSTGDIAEARCVPGVKCAEGPGCPSCGGPKIEPAPAIVGRRCGTCRHLHSPSDREPCLNCTGLSKWEPAEK